MTDVVYAIDGRIATITINRPAKRNAVDLAACNAIAAYAGQSVDDGARALVLTGAEGHFCAGADLGGVEDDGFRNAIRGALDAIRATPLVTIAAIDGFALGAGVQFSVACDLRVATPSARFGVPAAKLGLAVDHTTVQQVTSMLGSAQARAMLLACEEVTGQRAYELGFVNRLGAFDDALAWASHITSLAPLTIAAHKLAVNRLEPALVDADVVAAVERAWSSTDLAEGRAAFAAKRTPEFSGQ